LTIFERRGSVVPAWKYTSGVAIMVIKALLAETVTYWELEDDKVLRERQSEEQQRFWPGLVGYSMNGPEQ
jgi:hypothetical protein